MLWSDLFLRFVVEGKHKLRINHQIQTMISQQKELRSRVVRLRKQISTLQKEYSELQGDINTTNNIDNSSNKSFSNNSLLNGANN